MGILDRFRKKTSTSSTNEPSSHQNSIGESDGRATSGSPSRKQVTWAAAGLERSVTLKSESSRHYQQQTAGSRYVDKTYSDGAGGGGQLVTTISSSSAVPPMSTFDSDDSDGDGTGNHSGYYRYRRSGKHTNSTIDSRRSVMTSSYVIDGVDDEKCDDVRNSSRSIASNGGSGARVLDKLDTLEDRREAAIQNGDFKRAASADKQQAIVVLGETVLVNRETLRALRRTEKDMNDAETAGHHTLLELQRQLEVMYRVDAALDANDTLFERASKDIRAMFRQLARDKCMVVCCCTVCVVLLLIIIILIRKVALGFSLGTALGFGSEPPAPPPSPTLPTNTTN